MRTVADIYKEAGQAAETWNNVMGNRCYVSDYQFVKWATMYEGDIVDRAIQITGVKVLKQQFAKNYMSKQDIIKYASAVMRNLKREKTSGTKPQSTPCGTDSRPDNA